MKTKTFPHAKKGTPKRLVNFVLDEPTLNIVKRAARSEKPEPRTLSSMLRVLLLEAIDKRGLALALACLLFVSGCKFNEAVQAKTDPGESLRSLGQGKDNTK